MLAESMRYQISNKNELYGAGGYYDSSLPESAIGAIEDHGTYRVQRLAEVYAGSHYKRVPCNIVSDDSAFLETVSSIFASINAEYNYCAPSLAFEIENCFIHDSVIYLNGKPGPAIFYPTHRGNDRPFVRLLDKADGATLNAKVFNARGRRAFYLASAGSFNYGHWLVDDLPRVKWLLDSCRPTTIILQSFPGMDKIRAESIAALLSQSQVNLRFMDQGETLAFKNLTYVSPISFHPYVKNLAAVTYIRGVVRQRLGTGLVKSERLFIKRRPERGRSLTNLAEVEALLGTFGFSSIDPEDYGFEDQAKIFSGAKVIVGTMCAAMCNSLFTQSGAQLVYLAPDGWAEPFYWDLASLLGHSYSAVHGPRAGLSDLPHLDNFAINIELLKSMLASTSELGEA